MSDKLKPCPFCGNAPGVTTQNALALSLTRAALDEWFEKTAWVQDQMASFPLRSLGMHRADILRDEIRRLRAHVCQHIPVNFTTHRSAWREALTLARDSTTGDAAAYWQHELDAYDRAFTRLLDRPEQSRTRAEHDFQAAINLLTRQGWTECTQCGARPLTHEGRTSCRGVKEIKADFETQMAIVDSHRPKRR